MSLMLLLISAVNGEVTTWESLAFIVLYGFYVTVCYNMENFKIAIDLFKRKCLGKQVATTLDVSDRLDEDLLGHDVVMQSTTEGVSVVISL